MIDYKPKERQDLEELYRKQNVRINELEQENKKLKGLLKEHITTYDVHFDELIEENRKLKLHIEAKDKAYTALLKDYEELKEKNKEYKAEIEQRLKAISDLHISILK